LDLANVGEPKASRIAKLVDNRFWNEAAIPQNQMQVRIAALLQLDRPEVREPPTQPTL
jgi:hypothetical protein